MDPSGFLKPNEAGRPTSTAHSNNNTTPTVVKIVGTARDDLNGLLGFCTAYNRDRQRYMVTMASVDGSTSPNATVMALKADNLVLATTLETYRAQFQSLRTDPRVRLRLREYYDLCGKYCQPFEVEHVAGALLFVLVVLVYFVGFTKTLMLVSAIILVVCILVEDVVRARKPWREVLRNFPSRSKSVVERQFPFLRGKITEPIAAGLVGLLLAFTIQSVFFTNSNGSSSANSSNYNSASTPPPQQQQHQQRHRSSMVSIAQHRERLEEIYHLGFQDSLEGKNRGDSLPAKLEELLGNGNGSGTAAPFVEDDNYDDDLEPIPVSSIPYSATPLTRPAPPKTFVSRLVSMRTAGSVFYLYRMAMQIGVDPSSGIFSVAQLVANIQHNLPTWQKGMLAFSVYNLFSNLFL